MGKNGVVEELMTIISQGDDFIWYITEHHNDISEEMIDSLVKTLGRYIKDFITEIKSDED